MILFYIFLTILILTSALFIFFFAIKKWEMKAECFYTTLLAFIVSFAMTLVAIASNAATASINKANLAEYNELALYYGVVNESYDEPLRWNYYEKTCEWNEQYNNYLENNHSPWIGVYFGEHDYDGCDFIKLTLRQE